MSDILVVDDERDIRELICDILEDEGFTTRRAGNVRRMHGRAEQGRAGADDPRYLAQGQQHGRDRHPQAVKRDNPDVPVVIISGHGNIEIAVAAIKQGAYDFIEKPFNIDQLMVVIRRAMETSRLRRENAQLRRQEVRGTDMIGEFSAAWQASEIAAGKGHEVQRPGDADRGGAGSGKEVAARWIHANSNRSGAPFVTVNSAAIQPDHMEEVLFGRESPERGVEQGLLEQAHGGIIYFDEVADMPLGTQSKILRVLVDQSFTRVGGTAKVRVDLRVISSTTRDLPRRSPPAASARNCYHRLNVVPIEVPPLEDRREDIPELAQHFIALFNAEQGLPLRSWARTRSPAADDVLARQCAPTQES
jgi:two-component system nitrogen regulation response regulator NtrX